MADKPLLAFHRESDRGSDLLYSQDRNILPAKLSRKHHSETSRPSPEIAIWI